MIDYMQLRLYLYRTRKERKLSRGRIAEVVGISEDALGKIERGECHIKLENILKLLDAYGMSFALLKNFYRRSERMQTEMDILDKELKAKAEGKAKRGAS